VSGRPSVLLLGGLEPSGKAGLLADVDTCQKFKVRPWALATCLTAQGEKTFLSAPVAPAVLRRQWKALNEGGDFSAMKTGALPDADVLRLCLWARRRQKVPWVVDPVVRTSRAERLSALTRPHFLGLAGEGVVLTPNLPELAWLCGRPLPKDEAAVVALGQGLAQRGYAAVVVKGGHALGHSTDVVCLSSKVYFLRAGKRLSPSPHHRGTGCRFASALASALALGQDVVESARRARAHVREFLLSPP